MGSSNRRVKSRAKKRQYPNKATLFAEATCSDDVDKVLEEESTPGSSSDPSSASSKKIKQTVPLPTETENLECYVLINTDIIRDIINLIGICPGCPNNMRKLRVSAMISNTKWVLLICLSFAVPNACGPKPYILQK